MVDAIAGWHRAAGGTLVVGLSGPQGSGKSTLAAGLLAGLAARGLPTVCLGLDDIYLTRAERAQKAQAVHPLFATRGVPGTHDTALGARLLGALRAGRVPLALPRFDKAADDRAGEDQWQHVETAPAVVLFEGWCIGAQPQPASALEKPVNQLEAEADADGLWRRAVNRALAGPYQLLWAELDRLIILEAPDWPTVCGWRAEQERKDNSASMDEQALARFMMHYQRTTQAKVATKPGADIVVSLAADRSVRSLTR